MLFYIKLIATVLMIITVSLNVVANNFSRLTGIYIEKPVDLVVRKGNIYVSVMDKKTKFSGEEILTVVEQYRNQLPEKEALFEEAKRWYNMTRTLLEKR